METDFFEFQWLGGNSLLAGVKRSSDPCLLSRWGVARRQSLKGKALRRVVRACATQNFLHTARPRCEFRTRHQLRP
eukprot:1161745-Pelagomonas_calceolata.AAC.13